jgi:hypothetical protein
MIKKFTQILNEIAFGGNVGFEEMVKFYQKATPDQIKEMEKVTKANDWKGFKRLIKKVLNVKLV